MLNNQCYWWKYLWVHRLAHSHLVYAPYGMPQSNELKVEIWKLPHGLGPGTKLGLLIFILESTYQIMDSKLGDNLGKC